jgi:hypothetical protein
MKAFCLSGILQNLIGTVARCRQFDTDTVLGSFWILSLPILLIGGQISEDKCTVPAIGEKVFHVVWECTDFSEGNITQNI